MNEFDLIHQLTRSLPANDSVVVGPGDDCAVLDLGIPDRLLLFKTDAVVQGIHFTSETPPEKIGHKALARCLSDIAAMAGTPTSALVTIALPPKFDPAFIEKIYAGMSTLAKSHDVAIVGGETTTNPGGFLISIALLGTVPRGKCILRSGAKPGDALFVTGELGGSLSGRHLDFEPRLAEARWLAGHFSIHAMIDLSDGLAGDLRHIVKASKVAAELHSTCIPISRSARLGSKAEGSAKPPLLAALTDGEDFELLFAVASRDAVPLLDAWKKQFPKLKLTCIGKITTGEGITIRTKEDGRWPRMVTNISHSPEETLALGELWGRAATSGFVFGLTGDLGAGKTQLAKGIARGLGVTDRIHSPTFTLLNQYESGRLPLFHIDLYRLETPEQIIAAGLEEYFHPAGVTVIEWAERWPDAPARFKSRYRRVQIETLNETDRRITYEDFGG